MRQGDVYLYNERVGILTETVDGEYTFQYLTEHLEKPKPKPISLTLPCRKEAYVAKSLFPFFDGLIPEGWLLEISVKNWKIRRHDRMGLVLASCEDCIGAVSIKEIPTS